MQKSKLDLSDFPTIKTLQARQAHENFVAAVQKKIVQVSNKPYVAGQVSGIDKHGLKDALRRYGGPKSGLLKIQDADLVEFINQVHTKLTTHIVRLTNRVAMLSLKYLSNPQDSNKAVDAKCTLMVTLAYLESFKFVLKEFNKSFGYLRV